MGYTLEKLTIYDKALDHMLNDQNGAVGKYLTKRVTFMMFAAKRQVGVDTRELQRSIRMIHRRITRGQQYWLSANAKHALKHHEGTKPHLIVPNQAKMLRFSVGARMVTTRQVRHPGTKPNRYLSDQLYLVRF